MNIGSFGFQGGGGSGGAPTTLNFGLWTQLNDSVPVVNTLIETTILGNGVGSLLVPENTFQIGDTFGLTMCGNINAQNNAKLTIKLHANGIDIGSTGLLTLNQATTKTWELKAIFTIRALGFAGVGVLATNGNFNYNADASSSFEGINFSNIDSTNFDTTIPNILDVVAQWGTASLLDSISTTQVVLTKLF
jgi:hypothetical protein